jgi:hypothetical protein
VKENLAELGSFRFRESIPKKGQEGAIEEKSTRCGKGGASRNTCVY